MDDKEINFKVIFLYQNYKVAGLRINDFHYFRAKFRNFNMLGLILSWYKGRNT